MVRCFHFSWVCGCLWACGLYSSSLSGQQLVWRQYTSEQGLPGNVVYDLLEDSRGYVWFVTDQGICRFNGYTFNSPVDTSHLRGSEAFVPAEDPAGNIWFARLDGSLWTILDDTIRAWRYNAVAAPYFQSIRTLEQLSIADDGSVWLPIFGVGMLVVHPDGRHRVIKGAEQTCFLYTEVGGKLIYTSYHNPTNTAPPDMKVLEWKNNQAQLQATRRLSKGIHYTQRGIWKLKADHWLLYWRDSFSLIQQGHTRWQVHTTLLPEKISVSPTGALLLASHASQSGGLYYYASLAHFQRGEYKNLLPGRFVTDVHIDQQGGWWATTQHAGVWYCANPGIAVFDTRSGLPSNEVTRLTTDGQTTVYAGLRPGALVSIKPGQGKPVVMPGPPFSSREVQSIHFDALRQRLWVSEPLRFWDGTSWTMATHERTHAPVLAKQIVGEPGGQWLWSYWTFGFLRIDAQSGLTSYQSHSDEKIGQRTFSVTPGQGGELWVTTPQGLRLWQNGEYHLPPFEHPALRYQPRDVAILPDGSLVIRLLGAGLLIRNKQGAFTHLGQQQGLTSDLITRLYVSPAGELYACSHTGLNLLSRQPDGSWHIGTLDTRDGLPSSQINDVVSLGGELWLATNKGLVRVGQQPTKAEMPAPVLEQLRINNRRASFEPRLRLPHTHNNLSILFHARYYRSGAQIPYRYRLKGAQEAYTYTHHREVNFGQLTPGSYTFEVQAQNENGQWSKATQWSFEIRAAWWQTSWFWAALLLLLTGGLSYGYRRWLQQSKAELEVRNKVRELEAAALRAQMNPHFIFNCLGSIQHFITENDAPAATRYLARFARLVRLALHGSVDGKHSLRDEIEMLENYLALEQLRFRGTFRFEVGTAPDLDPDEILLPPMLVQPFVENALLHGMKNKQEGGLITVFFAQSDQFLLATITDNGPGISSPTDTPSGHRSVGMMLTHRRLDLLSDQRPGESFATTPILNEQGEIRGTQASLRIPID